MSIFMPQGNFSTAWPARTFPSFPYQFPGATFRSFCGFSLRLLRGDKDPDSADKLSPRAFSCPSSHTLLPDTEKGRHSPAWRPWRLQSGQWPRQCHPFSCSICRLRCLSRRAGDPIVAGPALSSPGYLRLAWVLVETDFAAARELGFPAPSGIHPKNRTPSSLKCQEFRLFGDSSSRVLSMVGFPLAQWRCPSYQSTWRSLRITFAPENLTNPANSFLFRME